MFLLQITPMVLKVGRKMLAWIERILGYMYFLF